MFKNLLSKVGWGELPSNFGFTVGEKVELPFSWHWDLHKGKKNADGSPVSFFICGKKDLDPAQVMAAKNAEQLSKSLRHPNILRAFNSIEVDGGFYVVTEEVVPLLAFQPADGDERVPAVWGLFQALDGLSFLHSSGFTHGLFGPLSIFVTPQGDFRVGGFELCQKGLDSGNAIAARRRVGPSLSGWPEPPASLSQGGTPSIGIDMWGAALLAAYVFGSSRAARYGPDVRLDMAKASQDVAPEFQKVFEELRDPKPLRGRSPIAEATQLPFFQKNSAVQVFSFLASLQLKSSEEKDAFFEGLPKLLEGLSEGVQTRQVLPELLAAQRFPGQEAAQVLPAILKIGVKLKEDEFREKVAPLVAQLFASPDRAVRFRLLSSIGDMIEFLDDSMINDKIFPECVNGFSDSNGPIREATVKSMIYFVPRLKPKTVESRVVKMLVKLLQDPEASIRTNAVICVGRVSSSLPKSCASQTVMNVVGMGMKDGFGPCRSSALHTLAATASLFTPEELAQRLLPGVCQRLVDPDQAVADTAFNVLGSLQQALRQMIEERRQTTANAAEVPAAGQAAPQTSSSSQGSGWSSWAMSTVGSVVGNKIMGSMGPAKDRSNSESAPMPPTAGGNAAAAAAAQDPPTQSTSSRRSSSGGMRLGGTAVAAGTGATALNSEFDDDVFDNLGDGWGDESENVFTPADGMPAPVTQDASNFDDDFFEEFDGLQTDCPSAAMGDGSNRSNSASASTPAARQAPAPARSSGPAAKPAATLKEVSSAPSMATAAKVSTAPKAKSAPKLDVAADDDFWKEFDM
eukprot:TRINITY_DN75314_c0_g1_i1.p1 TRINITY_DN75314_c0_g1~~TRINITY_DN75314_c0_g1_i1.p1  ORF type:complete len:832 (+),score=189.44 TRINITY_DN75314_c0_g1_i1:102-2498(+)